MPDFPFTPNSARYPENSATYRTSDSEQWVFRLSVTTCHRTASGSVATTPRRWATKSASVRVGPHDGGPHDGGRTHRTALKIN
jgi:hypothetical protein